MIRLESKMFKYLLMAALLVAVAAAAGYTVISGNPGDVRASIRSTLAGMNLTYYSIAGQPMNYTITPADIVSIEADTFDGGSAWKVRVGEGLAWDLTMDARGTKVLKVEQLFVT
ncbi:MAG TPA: hypothetical protein VLT35_00090 [Methanocella sp.]|nr:hypothetical protein [Methanocella sp.]